jgi:hypothetical protein
MLDRVSTKMGGVKAMAKVPSKQIDQNWQDSLFEKSVPATTYTKERTTESQQS